MNREILPLEVCEKLPFVLNFEHWDYIDSNGKVDAIHLDRKISEQVVMLEGISV